MAHAPLIRPDMLDDRISLEQGMRYVAPVTAGLIILNTAVFCYQMFTHKLNSTEGLMAAGAIERSAVFKGEFWRLATSTVLHAGWDHFVGNMLVLFVVGMVAEHLFGPIRTLAIYIGAGLVASSACLLSPEVTVGASGAIFGLIALVGASVYKYRSRFAVHDYRVGLVLLVWAIYSILMAILDPAISNLAHAGGLLTGACVSYCIRPRLLQNDRSLVCS